MYYACTCCVHYNIMELYIVTIKFFFCSCILFSPSLCPYKVSWTPLSMAGRGRTFSTSWSHPHAKSTAPITISAATTSTLERFRTMMRAHSLKTVSSTILLEQEVDRTLLKVIPGDRLGPTILASCHDDLFSLVQLSVCHSCYY